MKREHDHETTSKHPLFMIYNQFTPSLIIPTGQQYFLARLINFSTVEEKMIERS
jgi:hypothetical protein